MPRLHPRKLHRLASRRAQNASRLGAADLTEMQSIFHRETIPPRCHVRMLSAASANHRACDTTTNPPGSGLLASPPFPSGSPPLAHPEKRLSGGTKLH